MILVEIMDLGIWLKTMDMFYNLITLHQVAGKGEGISSIHCRSASLANEISILTDGL